MASSNWACCSSCLPRQTALQARMTSAVRRAAVTSTVQAGMMSAVRRAAVTSTVQAGMMCALCCSSTLPAPCAPSAASQNQFDDGFDDDDDGDLSDNFK